MFSRPRTARIVRPLECLFRRNNAVPRRTLISAPKPNDGPLMSRRSDRASPSVSADRKWLKTMPIFLVVVTVSTLAIFNYQKSSSSVVNSTLYALRTNAQAREVSGDEVYFASQIPWIWGKMNQSHGKIDIQFWVKGTRQKALMRFKSERKSRMGYFETLEWSSQTEDGQTVDSLKSTGADPFNQTPMERLSQGQAA